jgi:acyl-CoA dehydrogenase
LLSAALALAIALLYLGRAYLAWTGALALLLGGWALAGAEPRPLFGAALVVSVALAALFGIRPLRARALTSRLMPAVARLLPRLGETERVALEAGTVWWDGELFAGRPRWRRLLDFPIPALSEREQAFLEGPVRELCARLDDWAVVQAGDLPPEIWNYLRQERFFGMIIPESYGGLGFSALAHSAVVTRLSSRSLTAAVTVMVPNSLGPAELLLHYGTEEQCKHHLPRLARGEEIPCFALTGPEAGSDAAATQSEGVVCRGVFEGAEVLGMRLNWNKRYITLAPVATLIGLAFRLRDPDHLLGEREDLGITCALIPRHVPGIEIGRRHDPLGVPFQNGPIVGRDVFVPLEFIIGGVERAGQGWKMLMQSLAAGRSISLPSLSVGGSQLCARLVSAYAMVREQFDTPIGRFEGVEEPLARMAGLNYAIDAARELTAAAIDAGEKPAVLSAIVKAYLTDSLRRVVNDALDIRAGAGIMRGPRNHLARIYPGVPIGITVEGSNILTRSMIIYGQGALRCHPYAQREIEAVGAGDVAAFDRAFFGHAGFIARNAVRALLLGLTGGWLARPRVPAPAGAWLGRLGRASAVFALLSDVAMATLGGLLKRRERLSGRFADALAWMYLASAAVKRFVDGGQLPRDAAFARWSCEHALGRIDEAFVGILDNLPARWLARLVRPLVFPLGAGRRRTDDALVSAAARSLLDDPAAREALTDDIFLPPPQEPGLGRLEAALVKARAALAVERKIRDAVRAGQLDHAPGDELVEHALVQGIISAAEREQIHQADAARDEVIQVDAFEPGEFPCLGR